MAYVLQHHAETLVHIPLLQSHKSHLKLLAFGLTGRLSSTEISTHKTLICFRSACVRCADRQLAHPEIYQDFERLVQELLQKVDSYEVERSYAD